ncbi:MAG: glycine cleavage system protein GcvH [Acaryochloris sp. RU_4_1]|nr:glycine cleavage system protein GcvH [Acaryochloris sp. SU_5_25]NJM65047.1 glycine cleavage system protein GcvH [Acaryochloris sp. RU_4_1]NJN37597.1 glycine cleavage system protein GcvH [Acaryochloridaceae cyanobacterium CSU_3_4]NJR53845.1 glycine cleavage system protein GcvH [Acaryochloris sp. CRU_2_0]
MSFEYPEDLKYLDSHEYVRLENDVATVGITAFAIDQLGDIVFVELPEVGDDLAQGETMGNIESVKAVEDIYAPVSGTVLECNNAIVDAPEQLAADPYGEGWLIKIKMSTLAALDRAMSAPEYRAKVEGE